MEKKSLDVSKILVERNSEFLIVRENESGKWELPGGKIEDEDRFKAGSRELEEETDIRVESENLKDIVRVEVEKEECVNCFILHCEAEQEVQVDDEEISDFKWGPTNKFKEMDLHADAGFGIPPMVYLEEYLAKETNY